MSKLKLLILPLVIGVVLTGIVGVAAEYLSQESEPVTYGETGPFPETLRSEWVVEWIAEPYLAEDKLYHFSYAVYADVATQRAGSLPFLLNSHKAMIRETHQRMVQPTPGSYRHVSGADVKAEDMQEFLETDPRAYSYTGVDFDGKWTDKDGKPALAPFMFDTYWGDPEALDPQWIRETYQLPLAGQVDKLIDRYLAGVEQRRLTGDHRGTTLNLQVGAGADDANEFSNGFTQNVGTVINTDHVDEWHAFRWLNVTIGQGDTIDAATIDVWVFSDVGDEPLHTFFFHDDDDSSQVTTGGAGTNGVSGLARTSSVAWDNADLGTGAGGGFETTPSMATPVQAVVNIATWASGNAMQSMNRGNTGARDLQIEHYDGDSAHGAKLDIEYTAAGAARRIIIVTEVLPGVTTPVLPLLPVPLLLVLGLAGLKGTAV